MSTSQTTPPVDPGTPPPEPKESFRDKFYQSLRRLRSNEKFNSITGFAAANTRDSIAYVVLIMGIILLFFHDFYGGLLIGIISGFYFSSEFLAFIKSLNHLIDEQGIVRSLIAGGLILGLLVSAPAIFLGIAIAIGIRQIFFPDNL